MKEYDVAVEVGALGQTFEVTVKIEALDEEDAIQHAENYVRDNMYIVASDPEEIEE